MPAKADPLGSWFRLGMDMWMLGAESSSVIALRTMKLAAGDAAAGAEAQLMVDEKIGAAVALSQQVMMGQLGSSLPGMGSKIVADYRRKVRENQRRLTKR